MDYNKHFLPLAQISIEWNMKLLLRVDSMKYEEEVADIQDLISYYCIEFIGYALYWQE